MIWISVDPGVQNCGLCVWRDQELLKAYLWKSENSFPEWFEGDASKYIVLAVVEQMKVYPGARFAADLLDVSFAAGRVTAEIPEVVKVLPSAWKGQVPKKIHHARLAKSAKPEELAKIEAACIPSLRHNVMDAYGIGKWYIAGGKV
jgi:hypothetical protein